MRDRTSTTWEKETWNELTTLLEQNSLQGIDEAKAIKGIVERNDFRTDHQGSEAIVRVLGKVRRAVPEGLADAHPPRRLVNPGEMNADT